jgi:UDP-N-acetylglucosamine 3-dehydrogenase
MSAATLRVGLVGIGMMGRNHARVLSTLDGVQLVAIADPAGDRHRAAGGAPVVDTVGEMIEHGIDMAVVATPTGYHLAAGLELAAAGVPTLVEKPLATNVDESQQLVDAFEAAGLVNAVGHIERCNPALLALRERLDNGDLGEIYQVATRRQGPFPHRIADVGVVKDLGTHDIDLTSWLAQSRYTAIAARTTTRSGRPHEDMVSATGQLESGAITNHLVNWLSPMKERITVVTGERGAFVADTVSADLTFYENGTQTTEWASVAAFRGVSEGSMTRYALAKREPLRSEHEAFRDAILGISSDTVTMREGLTTLRVAEAVVDSARTGQSRSLPAA